MKREPINYPKGYTCMSKKDKFTIDIRRWGNKDAETLENMLSKRFQDAPTGFLPNKVIMTHKQFITLLATMLYEDESTLPDITFSRVMLTEFNAMDVEVKRRWW